MKYSIILFALMFFCSCNQESKSSQEKKLPTAQNTIEGSLKERMNFNLTNSDNYLIADAVNFQVKHKDEILKTIAVASVDTIPGKDLVMVCYMFSIGSDINRSSDLMKQIDGKWFFHNKYYSIYDDDPFENGKGEQCKAILKKAEEWRKASEKIWWTNLY
jgi:hypothetical protein